MPGIPSSPVKKEKPATSIELGKPALDLLSGVKGVVNCRTELLSGNVRYALQPFDKDGNAVKDAWEIDEHTLTPTTMRGLGVPCVPVSSHTPVFVLGSKLRDRITGFTGLATARTTFVNGCVFYLVESPHQSSDEKSGMSLARSINALHLEWVDEGISAAYRRPEPKADEPRPTGGPSSRISAQRMARF